MASPSPKPLRITLWPRRAIFSATPRPMPLVEPVTSVVLRSGMFNSFFADVTVFGNLFCRVGTRRCRFAAAAKRGRQRESEEKGEGDSRDAGAPSPTIEDPSDHQGARQPAGKIAGKINSAGDPAFGPSFGADETRRQRLGEEG